MPKPTIEVLRLQPLDSLGALKAFVDVRISDILTISELRLIHQAGRTWISGPQKTWTDSDGRKRYSTLITIQDREWMDALTEAILEAWADHPGGIKSLPERSQAGGF